MATRTLIFRTRVDARRKAGADRVLARLGLTAGQLVNMVFAQVELKNGIPFPLTAVETDDGHLPHVPNAKTVAALRAPSVARVKNLSALRAALRAKD
jgi:addiction module RelB/DinJ family antitoxin